MLILVSWSGSELPRDLLNAVTNHGACPRLHVQISTAGAASIRTLRGSPQLTTLIFVVPERQCLLTSANLKAPHVTRLLTNILQKSPNLERLALTLSNPENYKGHSCEHHSPCFDFRMGEKKTQPTHFVVGSYPRLLGRRWCHHQIDRLVHRLDWSRLQVLSTNHVALAMALIPDCPRLSNLTASDFKPVDMVNTLRCCKSLSSLEWTPYPKSQWEPEISEALGYHGRSLTNLSINRYRPGLSPWPLGLDEEATQKLCAAVPSVEFLTIGLYRDGSWVNTATFQVSTNTDLVHSHAMYCVRLGPSQT